MHIYNTKEEYPQAAVVYQETKIGHMEEFYHEKSAFIYYILEGSGKWIIEDEEYDVKAKDVIIVPPGKRFYFKGNLKQLCITAPAWDEKYEKHVRQPFFKKKPSKNQRFFGAPKILRIFERIDQKILAFKNQRF